MADVGQSLLIAPLQVPSDFSQLNSTEQFQRFASSFCSQLTRQFNANLLPKITQINSSVGAFPTLINGAVLSTAQILSGTGFTVSRPLTGVYDITFGTAFAVAPTINVICTGFGLASLVSATVSVVRIQTFNLSAVLTNADFNFLAVGRLA